MNVYENIDVYVVRSHVLVHGNLEGESALLVLWPPENVLCARFRLLLI